MKKIFIIIITFFYIFLLLFILSSCTSSFDTRKSQLNENINANNSGNSAEQIEQTESSNKEDYKTVEETKNKDNNKSEEVIDEEQLKNDLYSALEEFFTSVKSKSEYNHLSGYTKSLLGTEEEYKNEINSNIYSEIQKNNSFWENVKVKNILYYKDRALIIISGDRNKDGTIIRNDEESFKLINENDLWKIDFFLPATPEITPLSPEPDSISDYIGLIEIKFDILSFFPLRSTEIFLNEFIRTSFWIPQV